MELALQQATEETHKKMLEAQKQQEGLDITAANATSIEISAVQTLAGSQTSNRAMLDLESSHKKQEEQLMATMTTEEDQRETELRENMMYENELLKAEKERALDEGQVVEQAKELKLL